MEMKSKDKIMIQKMMLAFGFVLFSFLFFKYVFQLIAPFVIGWVLSLLFLPMVNFLEEKARIPRWIGSILSILLLLLFLGVVGMGLWNKLYVEAKLFYYHLPEYMAALQEGIGRLTVKLQEIKSALPGELLLIDMKVIKDFVTGMLPSLLQSGGYQSVNVLKAIPNIFMVMIVALISSYFFAKDKYRVGVWIERYFPQKFVEKYEICVKEVKTSISGYFKTQGILMFYTFTICIIGLLILRSPYALLLSVITSVIDAIPFFGSGFILWPGAVIYLMTGKTGIAVGYMIIYLCVNMMRQVMQPKILGTQIGLHPLLTLFSMYLGLRFLGIVGMILGPIVAVLVKAVFHATEVERRLHQIQDEKQDG